MLYYSIRSRPSGAPAPPLTGQSLEVELPDQPYDDRLLGQIDSVESGEVQGWACLRGALTDPLKVSIWAAHASKAGQAAGWHGQACGAFFGPHKTCPSSLLHAGQHMRVCTCLPPHNSPIIHKSALGSALACCTLVHGALYRQTC